MAAQADVPFDRRAHDPAAEARHLKGIPKPVAKGKFRTLGLGMITGAADDDPTAIGTYASAGATFGPGILWAVPLAYPMMVVVVYLTSKLGQVAGQGLTAVIREHYSRWVLWLVVGGVALANLAGTAADIGGISAAANLILPIPMIWFVVPITFIILGLQIFGSYELIRSVFRWVALALFAYIGAALLARPDAMAVLRGTFVPSIHMDRTLLTMLVAVVGTSLSPYLFVWEPDQQVSEDISLGRRRLTDRKGFTREEQKHSFLDVSAGMLVANVIIYFIILCTGSTLFRAGIHEVNTAAEAASALRPLAGNAAGLLFAAGLIGVGFLAIPVMTTGIAYAICQAMGWKHGLHCKLSEARQFYAIIVVFHLLAMSVNFFGLNPIKALLWAGVVEGLLTAPLMLLTMLITNNRTIMGRWVNRMATNIVGWATTAVTFAASFGVLYAWLRG
jgi:NRAMP (natural resistance-associated macrophage protein)-like metal ion transporter